MSLVKRSRSDLILEGVSLPANDQSRSPTVKMAAEDTESTGKKGSMSYVDGGFKDLVNFYEVDNDKDINDNTP